LTAKGVIRALENYVIKTGFQYQASSPQAQKVLDDFCDRNNWFMRELDLFRRTRRDGEFIVRLTPQDDAITEVRTIEPEQIRPPMNTPEWMFGVLVDTLDKEKILGLWVTYSGDVSDGEELTADEFVFMKINVDMIIRRGLSDFFCSQESLQGVQKLLRAGVQGESVRQAIAYVRQFQQAPQQTVLSMQSANTDYLTPLPTAQGVPRLQPVHQVVPGSVTDIPEGLEFQNGPTGAGANAVSVLQAAYQQLSTYWQVPSWVISGDTGSTNYSASLTSESPFVRNCEKEQKIYSMKFREIMLRVIDIAVQQGVLPDEKHDVIVHVPPVWVRNAKEESDRNQVLSSNGLLSKRTWSDREELNFEAEKENMANDNDPPTQPMATTSQSTTPGAEYKRQTGDV
jgi:hypothetical protein